MGDSGLADGGPEDMRREAAGRPSRALIVAVERYAGGSAWDLDGPVRDALGYARRLLGSGLDPRALTLLLSPLPHNAAEAERSGLRFRPADRETVHTVLFRELLAGRGGFLMVTWSGHGLVDLEGRHRLLYADAVADDIRSLDLDAALAAYRSDRVSSYPEQLWLIDACQIFADPVQAHGALRPDPVPGGRPRPRPSQCALFACAPGQTARNGAITRSGTFSSEALKLLTWPADPEKLVTGLRRRFEELGREGRVRQTPTYFWHTGPRGEYAYDGGGHPASPHHPPQHPPRPRRPHPYERPSLEQRRRLLEALEAVPALADPATRGAVLRQLPTEISSSIPRSPITRLDLLQLIDTCLDFPGGLLRLWEAVSMADSGTHALNALEEALAQMPGFRPDS